MVCSGFEGCVQSDSFGREYSVVRSHIDAHRSLASLMYAARPKNSPAVWWPVMEWVFADVWDVCDPYINDIIIGTQTKEGMSDQDLIVVGL